MQIKIILANIRIDHRRIHEVLIKNSSGAETAFWKSLGAV